MGGLGPWAEVAPEELERRYVEYLATARPETPEATEQRRRAALEQAYAAFPRLAEHVQSIWGLTLPRTLTSGFGTTPPTKRSRWSTTTPATAPSG